MPSLGNYICADCGRTMKPERNGTIGIEMLDDNQHAYKMWYCDLYKCPKCGHKILCGFANSPLKEHFEDGFDDFLKDTKENPKELCVEFI